MKHGTSKLNENYISNHAKGKPLGKNQIQMTVTGLPRKAIFSDLSFKSKAINTCWVTWLSYSIAAKSNTTQSYSTLIIAKKIKKRCQKPFEILFKVSRINKVTPPTQFILFNKMNWYRCEMECAKDVIREGMKRQKICSRRKL